MNAMLNINIVKIMNICNVSDKLEFGRTTELNRSIPNCMVACIRARFDDIIGWNNESKKYTVKSLRAGRIYARKRNAFPALLDRTHI